MSLVPADPHRQGSPRPRLLSSGTRRASLGRLVMGALIAPPTAFLAAALFGSGAQPLGIIAGVPPLALLWYWFADAIALLRSLGATPAYRQRPRYMVALVTCIAIMLAWIVSIMVARRNGTIL